MRLISHTEAASLLTCPAQHDFRYVGHLAGSALRPRTIASILHAGRAWGAGVAQWHRTGEPDLADTALRTQLNADAQQQIEQGVYLEDEHRELFGRLAGILAHHVATAERIDAFDGLERELVVAVPSRTGRKASTRYRLQCFLDGVHCDEDGRVWIVEFKLRRQLSSLEQVSLSRQIRWYAYAWWQHTGQQPAGVIVDERWNELPRPARILKDGGCSHDKSQLTTPDAYLAACEQTGCKPNPETLEALCARRWQQRHHVPLRPLELVQAGRELVSIAQQIQDLESGRLHPVRNSSPRTCPGCAFREICAAPDEIDVIDALFDRVAGKRDRVAAWPDP